MSTHDIVTFFVSLVFLFVVGDLASTFLYHVPQSYPKITTATTKNPDVEFGDLFRFYDAPGRAQR